MFVSEPEFNLSPSYIDSGTFNADKMKTYNYEASWGSAPYWLSSEYVLTDITAPSLNNPT